MSGHASQTKSVVVERQLPHPPEKIWRALTQPHLIAEWLMANDFAPVVDHRFAFRMEAQPNWNGVIDCRVLEVEPQRTLTYSWGAFGLETVVTWTLRATAAGTHLRMEHAGFGRDQAQAFAGATHGWQRYLTNLEQVLARTE